MKERPILFSAPMVVAIREERKFMTRRVMRHPEYYGCPTGDCPHSLQAECNVAMNKPDVLEDCPYGASGDRLWVRETWGLGGDCLIDRCLNYAADGAQRPINQHKGKLDLWYPYGSDSPITSKELLGPSMDRHGWRPSIHMPRWASRITLEITGVKVERVRDISEEDARLEGVKCLDRASGREAVLGDGSYRDHFRYLWKSLNDLRPGCSWEDNPFVWCVSFKLVA